MQQIILTLGALATVVAGCGPFPGYRSYREPPPPEGPDGQAQQEVRIVDTGRRGVYYLIDPNRRLCFFHSGRAVTPVDCATLPEAADLVADQQPQPEAAEAPIEEPVTEPVEEPSEASTYAQPAPPDPAGPPAEAPPGDGEVSDRSGAADLGLEPTADEKRRFTLAYVAIFCDQREGRAIDPTVTIEREGLTSERYSQIEGWMASDKRVWRALRTAAITSCPEEGGRQGEQ